jgi:TolA-binding protein
MMKHFGSLILSLVLFVGVGILAHAADNGQKTAGNASNSASSAVSTQLRTLEQQEKIDLQS